MNSRDDIELPSGRIIRHVPEANGAQYAVPATGPDEMSELEWDEYCGIVADRNRKFFHRRRAMNRAAFLEGSDAGPRGICRKVWEAEMERALDEARNKCETCWRPATHVNEEPIDIEPYYKQVQLCDVCDKGASGTTADSQA